MVIRDIHSLIDYAAFGLHFRPIIALDIDADRISWFSWLGSAFTLYRRQYYFRIDGFLHIPVHFIAFYTPSPWPI